GPRQLAAILSVSVLYARVQSCSSLVRGKLATGKALAEQALVAFNTGGAGEGKPKETGTEDSGGREGEQGRPTGSEGGNGCGPQRSRHSTGPASSEEANELGGLGTPAATNLKCKDNKPAPLRTQQLRVGERTTLRLKQGNGRKVKHCAEAAGGAIIDNTGSRCLSGPVGAVVKVFSMLFVTTAWRAAKCRLCPRPKRKRPHAYREGAARAVASWLCPAWRLAAGSAERLLPSFGSWPKGSCSRVTSAVAPGHATSLLVRLNEITRKHGATFGRPLADVRDAEPMPASRLTAP
ncbi:unnamed protein product, partial [Symbiodinium sp. KB8]